jgi:hypothetical protein
MRFCLPDIIALAVADADKSGIKKSIKNLRVAETSPARCRSGHRGHLCRSMGAETVSFRFSER